MVGFVNSSRFLTKMAIIENRIVSSVTDEFETCMLEMGDSLTNHLNDSTQKRVNES